MERVCAAEISELMQGLPQSGAERDRAYRERKKREVLHVGQPLYTRFSALGGSLFF